jgi:hypothetical protein
MVSAREIIDACVQAAGKVVYPASDEERVLAVIRVLAAQGTTDAMDAAWLAVPGNGGPDMTLGAMLTALADGYEREGGG